MAEAELTKIGKLFFLIFLLIFLISFKSLFAQTTITAKLSDDKIGVGEIFTLSVTIDNSVGKITIPDIDGLMLRGTSKSVNMMYSSGSLKTIQTYSYNYVAIKEGFYTIDKITVKANNNTYIANPVSIEVVSDSVRNSILNKPEGDSFERFMNYREDIMVNNTINKKEFYIYEPIYIEQKAYSHVPVNVIGISKIPDRNDFLVYTDSSERNSYTEIIDGKRVNVIPLKKEVLFAVKQGEKNILTTPFVFEKNNMFYDRIQYGEEEFDIKILSLPSAKDYKNFSGAVGDFKFNTKINKTNINIGDEVLISIEVIGEGNISIINMPNLNDDIKNYFSVYQPKIFETNWFENNKMIGKKTKEYILVATNKGNYTIENIDFCYFSPNDKSYTNIYAKNNFQPWLTTYAVAPGSSDVKIAYTKSDNTSNLLLTEMSSRMSRYANTWRYGCVKSDLEQTLTSSALNVTGGQWAYRNWYSGDNYYVPKYYELFIKTDINASSGIIYTIFPTFRNEEVLLNRAEAYVMLEDYEKALADLNIFCRQRIKNYNEEKHVITEQTVVKFYNAALSNEDHFMKKYNAYGSASWSDVKKALILCILDFRRNEFMWEGLRWWDMMRYRIPITHTTKEGDSNTLYPGDDRWLLQLPETAELADVQLNPRSNFLSRQW